ncbi:MAG: TRCF domain-containing protein, partial [Gammaproteobacteria bacterium]
EQVMLDFYHRRIACLVCTTIIETGIDVPNANTIIINRADKFGLAQLYQLRGRVGRSHHRAYAYLVVPSRKALKGDALRRLEAIESIEDLGIGFTLATHDLEIRGAGEILGEEQSGHIQEVGFGLFTELLERAIQALKAGRQPELDRPLDHGVEIEIHVPVLIPGDYVPDVHTRLIMYKRIANAGDLEELLRLEEEMIDRFGTLPRSAKDLLRITRLKQRAAPLGVRKIDLGAHGGRVLFHAQAEVDPLALVKLMQTQLHTYRLEQGDKIRITASLPDGDARIGVLDRLIDQLGQRAAA